MSEWKACLRVGFWDLVGQPDGHKTKDSARRDGLARPSSSGRSGHQQEQSTATCRPKPAGPEILPARMECSTSGGSGRAERAHAQQEGRPIVDEVETSRGENKARRIYSSGLTFAFSKNKEVVGLGLDARAHHFPSAGSSSPSLGCLTWRDPLSPCFSSSAP